MTGSLNASLAQWLLASGRLTAPYVAAQGTRARARGAGLHDPGRRRHDLGRRSDDDLHQWHSRSAVGLSSNNQTDEAEADAPTGMCAAAPDHAGIFDTTGGGLDNANLQRTRPSCDTV